MSRIPKFRRVIQLELNEISPVLIKQLVTQGHLPNFKRVIESWHETKTTSEDIYEQIEPWIQWVTAHTGKAFKDHGIFRLGDAHDLKHEQIWEVLSKKNISCAIIGAMNATPGSQKDGIFFPDPWSKSNSTLPTELKGLWTLISSRVQSHASSQPRFADMVQALAAAKKFKLSVGLMARIARQVVSQKLEPRIKWRLAGLFDLFLAELFCNVLKDKNHRFLTLFLNSVAHYQHHFWRNLEPAKFSNHVTAPDCRPGDNPLLYGYEVMDEVLGRVLADVDLKKDLVLIISGLSQVPDQRYEDQGGMNYYRLIDHKQFAAQIGLAGDQIFPLMSRDWQVKVPAAQKQVVRAQLESFRLGSEPLFRLSEDSDGYIFVETAVTRLIKEGEIIYKGDRALGPFEEYFVRMAVKSGHHTSIGILWSSENLSSVGVEKTIPLTKIFDVPIQVLSS